MSCLPIGWVVGCVLAHIIYYGMLYTIRILAPPFQSQLNAVCISGAHYGTAVFTLPSWPHTYAGNA